MMYTYGTGNGYNYGGYPGGVGYGAYTPVGYVMPTYNNGGGFGNNFAMILVLFILLVVIGCSCGFGQGNCGSFGCDC